MALEIVRVGRYRARFASSEIDVSAAQSLRYQCFNLSNKDELDVDDFDTLCQHVLIENLETEQLKISAPQSPQNLGVNLYLKLQKRIHHLKKILIYI